MKTESTYLTSGNDVLIVRKDLATAIGLNEAIIINQIHYWIQKNKDERHFKDGKYWMYETYEGWHEQIPFLSIPTIKRAMKSLKQEGLVETQNFNKKNWDRTVWYSVNYEKIDEIVDKMREDQNDTIESVNMIHSIVSNCNSQLDQDDTTNTIDYSYNTTKTTSKTTNELFTSDEGEHIKHSKQYVNRIREKISGWEETRYCLDTICEGMRYFFDKYMYETMSYHPKLSDKALRNVVKSLSERSDEITELVDQYFKTNFREDVDYHITHFAQPNVLEILSYECGYGCAVAQGR